MTDIVERLRDRDAVILSGLFHAIPTMNAAADEIERLRSQLVKNEEVFRKVLHACNVPASYSQERVRGEIVGIISAALTDETRT